MRMGAFLRDGGSLHQSAVDVPINRAIRVNDLVGIILRDDRNGFLFAPGRLEAETGIGLCCLPYDLLPHWSHRIHGERCPEPLPIVRFGSLATACIGSLAIVRFGSLATASVGSLAIACSGSLLTGGFGFLEVAGVRFFVIAFIGGLSGVLGADFCVIT